MKHARKLTPRQRARLGGYARAARLSKKQLVASAKHAARVRWSKTKVERPHA